MPKLEHSDWIKIIGWIFGFIGTIYLMRTDIAVIKADMVSVRSEIAFMREDIRALYNSKTVSKKKYPNTEPDFFLFDEEL